MQRTRSETRRQLVKSAAARRLQEIEIEIEAIFRAFPVLRTTRRGRNEVASANRVRPNGQKRKSSAQSATGGATSLDL